MTVVLKLGGSLLTDKAGRESIDTERLAMVAETIGRTQPSSLVLIHGAGSFGHPLAAQYGVSREEATRNPTAVSAIGSAMTRLNQAFIDALIDEGVPAVSVATGSMAWLTDGTVAVDPGALTAWLEEGFVPVARGDIVARTDHGAGILSGDDLSVELATALDADRLGLCSNVPGVLDDNEEVIDEITRYGTVESLIGSPDGTDVTGGMGGKIRTILDSGVDGSVFGIDDLAAFLDGNHPGTRVMGEARSF